jgi:integrase
VRQFVICNRWGKPYTDHGFRSVWYKDMQTALKRKLIAMTFTFHDLRAKSLSDDSEEAATARSGHTDAKMTRAVYRRKPTRARPLR